MCFLIFHFGVHLYFPSLANESLHFYGLKSVLCWGSSCSWAGSIFFSCFVPCPCLSGEREFPLVFFLSGVCSGPATEVTSEVMAPELFLSGFACLSQLVATLVFGSLESFSVTASITFFLLDQCSHFIYKLGHYLGFCGCACFTHMTALFFGCWDISFVTSTYFVVSTIFFASG